MAVNRFALLLALLSTVFWAGSQVASSIVLDRVSPELYVILIEIFFIIIGSVFVLFNTGAAKAYLKATKANQAIRTLIFGCAASILVYEVSFYFALSYPAKLTTIVITSLWPLFTVFWGLRLRISSWPKLQGQDIGLALLAFVGAAVVTADHFNFAWGKLLPQQIILAFVAAVSGGFWDASVNKIIDIIRTQPAGVSGGRPPAQDLSSANIVVFSLLLARAILIPAFVAWFFLSHQTLTVDKTVLITAGAITLFGYVVSDIIFSLAISYSGAAIISISYLVPILVTLLFKVVYGQTVSVYTLIGLYLVFFANFMIHTRRLKISPAMGATVFFILIVSGSFVINPDSVKSLIGAEKSSDTVMQLVMAALALALGFLLQQADARNRDERAYLVNLFNLIFESARAEPQAANKIIRARNICEKILELRTAAGPIRDALERATDLTDFFGLGQPQRGGAPTYDGEAKLRLAFQQWFEARKSIDDGKDTWFLGALIFAIGLSIVVTSVATPFLIILSGIGASLLCYLWILLNGTLVPDEIKLLETPNGTRSYVRKI